MSVLQRDRPLLVEFWDFCRPNSIRTLPYVKAWHERYGPDGLRVVSVHCPGFDCSRDEQAVRDSVTRLGIEHPVLIDSELELWQDYENEGWPARYLFDGHARLFEYHYGEGAYQETELAIQQLLGLEREPIEPLRPEDAPGARLAPQTADQAGAYSGPYEAGAVWAVLDGRGTLRVEAAEAANGDVDGDGHAHGHGHGHAAGSAALDPVEIEVSHPGAYLLIEHERHIAGTIALDPGPGVVCVATCFTPGVTLM